MPKPPRFFISPNQVSGQSITVSGEDVSHIVKVLRMKTGDELLLCDGKGTEYSVNIAQVTKSDITTDVKARSKREIREPLIILGQGLPKSDKMDWIVQKATELGVATIVPLVTERTIVKIKDEEKRVSRWQKICREAAMQCNRPDIPQVGRIVSFSDFLRPLNPEPRTLLLLPWEEGTVPIKEILRANPGIKNVVVLIGPEGGFSAHEAEMAKERGFSLVSLGQNILRTETAAMAVLSMILYETSDNS
ncbi:MAG: 16S rRNA (uracil(1498)-N(3))-methyltransferase [Nitrospirae bacterium]|nr:16S rRNA (uracil(1498)-N(3))-methyltransferase [Nitrospirota bacterium]